MLHPNGKKALADAKSGIENALSVAFQARTEARRVSVKPGNEAAMNNDEPTLTTDTDSPMVIEVLLNPELQGIVMPSEILSDESKFHLIRQTFDSKHKMACSVTFPPTSDVLEKADCLYNHLKIRLGIHIKSRVNQDRHNNKCLAWAKKNLVVVAAYMIIADHIVTDISCLDEFCCLLKPPSNNNFLKCSNEELTHVGCYLHYNVNQSVWVRSGSAAGAGGFGQRLEQHIKRAELDTNPDNSQFYDNYPSVKSIRSKSNGKRGAYEHLEAYIGASFSRDDLPPGVCSSGENVMFFYSDEEVEWINNLHCHGKQLNEKYVQMVAYLFELGYDLAISRTHFTAPASRAVG